MEDFISDFILNWWGEPKYFRVRKCLTVSAVWRDPVVKGLRSGRFYFRFYDFVLLSFSVSWILHSRLRLQIGVYSVSAFNQKSNLTDDSGSKDKLFPAPSQTPVLIPNASQTIDLTPKQSYTIALTPAPDKFLAWLRIGLKIQL